MAHEFGALGFEGAVWDGRTIMDATGLGVRVVFSVDNDSSGHGLLLLLYNIFLRFSNLSSSLHRSIRRGRVRLRARATTTTDLTNTGFSRFIVRTNQGVGMKPLRAIGLRDDPRLGLLSGRVGLLFGCTALGYVIPSVGNMVRIL
jgi:hypothetical protein